MYSCFPGSLSAHTICMLISPFFSAKEMTNHILHTRAIFIATFTLTDSLITTVPVMNFFQAFLPVDVPKLPKLQTILPSPDARSPGQQLVTRMIGIIHIRSVQVHPWS